MTYRAPDAAVDAAALAAPDVPAEQVLAILDAGCAVAVEDALRGVGREESNGVLG